MTTKPNSKLLLIIIGILLVTNIAMLIILLKGRPVEKNGMRAGKKAMMMTFLQKEIGFSQQQLVQYDSLNEQHRRKVRSMFEAARKEKEGQIKEMTASNFNEQAIDSIASLSAGKQKAMEAEMFYNYKNIRNICNPAQLPAFDSLFYSVLNKRPDDRKK